MIEPRWLENVIAFAQADTNGIDPGALAGLLGDDAEVLPYLIVHANGFAAWPKARTALLKAASSVARPPDQSGPRTNQSAQRGVLYDAVHATITASAGDLRGSDGTIDNPNPADLANLIARVRLDEDRGCDPPSMFIRHA